MASFSKVCRELYNSYETAGVAWANDRIRYDDVSKRMRPAQIRRAVNLQKHKKLAAQH